MPYIPHTPNEVREMLKTVGAESLDALFDEIPKNLLLNGTDSLPRPLTEIEIDRLMRSRAAMDDDVLCFAGGGTYQHYVPSVVWDIATRGEFYSSYTPYQAEASQGTLQLLYEYQSMMASLMEMDVSNASLYDGASALGEAILMAVRANRRATSRKVLVPRTVDPAYRKTAHTLTKGQGIELVDLDFDPDRGTIPADHTIFTEKEADYAALVVPLPGYFGTLEDVHQLTDWAHSRNMLVIAQVNPLAVSILSPPGEWGKTGADIACGSGQPLGVPMSSGGPSIGFLCCRQDIVRQMPGRIVGRTVDVDGKDGFALTLQAREQHIRRSKATSNICTNQGLIATVATIFMSLMGPSGLKKMAALSHSNTAQLVDSLASLPGVEQVFDGPVFHEAVLRLPKPPGDVLAALARKRITGGVDVSRNYPELGNALLVCATEIRTAEEIDRFTKAIKEVLC